MNIDWFTFAAQIVNFLILVVALRWLLYGPIVRAMEQREQDIALRLEQAEQMQRRGEARVEEYEQKIQEAESQRESQLKNARREADEEHQRMTARAREDVQRQRMDWLMAFDRERNDLVTEMQQQAGKLSAQATRRTLAQLADESLEDRMFANFDTRLRDMAPSRKQEIMGYLGHDNHGVTIRSAFEMTEAWQDRLARTVREQFEYEGKVNYQVSPELVCGIELETAGYSFAWNVHDFLRRLEAEFDESLKSKVADAKP